MANKVCERCKKRQKGVVLRNCDQLLCNKCNTINENGKNSRNLISPKSKSTSSGSINATSASSRRSRQNSPACNIREQGSRAGVVTISHPPLTPTAPPMSPVPEVTDRQTRSQDLARETSLGALAEFPVVNEMLCYLSNFIGKSDNASLSSVLDGFYTDREVTDAKQCLWSAVSSDIIGPFEMRKNNQSRSAKTANILDILAAMRQVTTQQSPTFVARDLSRIPAFTFQKTVELSVLNRLEAVERKLDGFQPRMNSQSQTVNETDSSPPTDDSLNQGTTMRSTISTEKQRSTYADITKCSHKNVMQKQNILEKKSARNEIKNVKVIDDEGFQMNKHDRKRLMKSKVVGTKMSNKYSINGAKATKEKYIFVYNVRKDTDDSDMKQFLLDEINMNSFERVSHVNAKNKSYKICIDETDLDKVFDPNFWPFGVSCKFYKFRSRGRFNGTYGGNSHSDYETESGHYYHDEYNDNYNDDYYDEYDSYENRNRHDFESIWN